MKVMEAIETRRSVRKYSDKPIEREKLELIAEAFRLAPSARNAQNWKLFIVSCAEKRAAIRGAALGKPEFLAEAPVILVACGLQRNIMTNKQRADSVDVSIAATCVMLEAWEQGLGTCWMAAYDEDGVKKALGLPEDISAVMITPLGYPAETPGAKPRKEQKDVVEYI